MQRLTQRSCLQNVITDELPDKMQIQPLPREIQPSLQEFQVRQHPSSKTQTHKTITLSVCVLFISKKLVSSSACVKGPEQPGPSWAPRHASLRHQPRHR